MQTHKVLQLRVVELQRAVQLAAPRIQTKVSRLECHLFKLYFDIGF